MSKKNDKAPKLQLKKESLRTLVDDQLAAVNGGVKPPRNNCTGRLSGCISGA